MLLFQTYLENSCIYSCYCLKVKSIFQPSQFQFREISGKNCSATNKIIRQNSLLIFSVFTIALIIKNHGSFFPTVAGDCYTPLDFCGVLKFINRFSDVNFTNFRSR